MLPMAVPGLVLGLGYIFFFNEPGNPLNGLYHTVTLLTLCTIVHFYTTGHLTAVTALKALDAEFESVSASLKVPFYKTFWRVTLPICTPALVDIARYFFINAMTTISAVVFLYSSETKVASIAILNLDVRDTQSAAIQLYESLDYVRWGTHPAYARVNGETIAGYFYYRLLEPQHGRSTADALGRIKT